MRQTFEEGQTVYVAQYSRTNWKQAVVVTPDIEKKAYGYGGPDRMIHYVGVRFVRDGQVVDQVWEMLNNRQKIITIDRHAEIDQAAGIVKMHGDIQEHRNFESGFAEYVTVAAHILDTFTSPNEVTALATYLRGMYTDRSPWSTITPERVTEKRHALRREAQAACARLLELGQEPPELP